MSEEIVQFVEAFLVENTKPEMTMQQKLELSNDQRDRAVAIADGVMAWESLADTRKSIKDLAALKSEIGKTDCPKCKGTGWHMYSHDHSTICDACCKHEEGWWDLTEHYSGYKKDADNGCCRKGCGTLRRDLIK
jgi:hypothetical protein